MSNNDEMKNDNYSAHDESVEETSKKSGSGAIIKIFALLIFVAVSGFGFLYWFQMNPEHKDDLENITGMDLSGVDSLAKNVGEQTNSVLSKTPLGETILSQSEVEAGTQNQTLETQNELSSNQTTTATENVTSDVNQEDAGNIIQPPKNAPVMTIVTEADPNVQAAKDEEERAKALAEIEAALAGNNVVSSPLSSEEGGMAYKGSMSTGTINAAGGDKVISPNFINNLAMYLASNYSPSEGVLISPVQANMHYGANLYALPQAGNLSEARKYILNYVYTPENLSNLYAMYSDKFIQDLQNYAAMGSDNRKALNQEEQAKMFKDYANYLNALASSAQSVLAVDNLAVKANQYSEAFADVVKAKNDFATIQVAYEEARYNQADTSKQKNDLVEASKVIDERNQTLNSLRENIVSEIKGNGNTAFPDSTLLYMFEWFARRENATNGQSKAANSELIAIFYDMANRLNAAVKP